MHWMNTMVGYCGPYKYDTGYCQRLKDYIIRNLHWMEGQMESGEDPQYWHQVSVWFHSTAGSLGTAAAAWFGGQLQRPDPSPSGLLLLEPLRIPVTSFSLYRDYQLLAVSGPTWDQVPPFQWSRSPYSRLLHMGHPDTWAFPVVTSFSLYRDYQLLAVSGPTWDQVPPFQWSRSPYSRLLHMGHPDTWAFPVVRVCWG
ncbi:UNVERIFIED_CONTAM: hypothetical protein FKN15_028548 [Acipenser sinensis]